LGGVGLLAKMLLQDGSERWSKRQRMKVKGRADSMDLSPGERTRLQTVDEWLLEYETGKPILPGIQEIELTRPQIISHILRYESHRTTTSGRLVLVFIDIGTGQEVNAFYNVDIKRIYGKYKGTSYRTGLGGQFNVTPRYKFYKFWMNVVEKKPFRWCKVHKELKSKFGNLKFTGELSTGYKEDGSPFMQVKNLHKVDTTRAQTKHIFDTTEAQLVCTTN